LARSGINYVDVAKAAETVRQNDEEPTVDRVRAVLGTGSKSTIAPLLKKWKEQSGSVQLITGVPKELSDAVRSIYEQAKATAEADFSKRADELDQKHQGMASKLSETATQLASQKEENRSLLNVTGELKANLSDSQEQNTQLQTKLVKLQAELSQTQTLLSNAKETVSELKSENKDIRAHFEHYQQHSSEERQRERDEHTNSLQTERDRNNAINKNLELLRKELSDSQTMVSELTVSNSEQKALLEGSKAEFQAANANLQRFTDESKAITKELQTTTKLLNKAKEEGIQLRSNLTLVNKENEMLQSKVAELVTQLEMAASKQEKLNDKLSLMSQEKSVIQGQFIQLQNSL